MPRGIYDRKAKSQPVAARESIPVAKANGGIRTEVGFMDHQSANQSVVETIRQTHGDENVSTTEKLFGDLIVEANPALAVPEAIPQSPEEEEKEEPKTEEVKPEAPTQEKQEPAPEPTEDEILDFEKFATKKVKVKVDGREEALTLKEIRDSYQIGKHLNMAADRVGEERRRLADEKRQIDEWRQKMAAATQPVQSDQQPVATPHAPNDLMAKVQFLEQKLSQIERGVQPVVERSARQTLSDELKMQGFDDFDQYWPKMNAFAATVRDPAMFDYYNTLPGGKALYFELKAQDLQERLRQPVPQPAVPVSPIAAPRPPITRIDGGSQPSSVGVDDSRFRERQAFQRAKTTGDKDAWNEVILNRIAGRINLGD